MGLDVFDLAAVAGAVERHDDGGDAGVAKRREQAGLVGGMKLGGTLVVFRPALEEVARVEGWRRDVDGHGVSPEMKKPGAMAGLLEGVRRSRSEEHTSELQSLMRISYAVFCLKKKQTKHNNEK